MSIDKTSSSDDLFIILNYYVHWTNPFFVNERKDKL